MSFEESFHTRETVCSLVLKDTPNIQCFTKREPRVACSLSSLAADDYAERGGGMRNILRL